MSYILTMQEPILNEIDKVPWFYKSYSTIPDWGERDPDLVDKDFEKKFNIKLHYGKKHHYSKVMPIIAFEFTNMDHATMFILEWS